MNPGGGYANLGTQTKSVAVSEACGRIMKDARAVHAPQELLCQLLVLCMTLISLSACNIARQLREIVSTKV